MEKTVKLSAISVASQLDLKGIKASLGAQPLVDGSSELFYNSGPGQYQYYFSYGMIIFCGHTKEEIDQIIKNSQAHLKSPGTRPHEGYELQVITGSELQFGPNRLVLDHTNDEVVRIIMLNLAQSLALEDYIGISESLLTEIKALTNDLQSKGKLGMSRRNMLKFIGRALNTQNDIAENIHAFNTAETWENEYANSLQKGMVKHFDLKMRFNKIEYTLRIIQINLSVFREISNQSESNRLEWIVIILILIEVFDLFISKYLFQN